METASLDLTGVDLTTEVVRTARLVLRPFRPDDVPTVHRASQDPGTQRWISAIPVPYTLEDARAFVEGVGMAHRAEGRGLPVAVEADGELVGTAGLSLGPGRLGPEIGYTIAPWARGRRYAAEATDGLATWAFAHGAPRVHLFVDVDNAVSQAVARRAGFTREGVVRGCLARRDGSRADAVLFGRLPGDRAGGAGG
ncbi:RimJ/RimL family protein N-acetyltransferase [Geodermatophilus bullaregiensis]|uniref:GNAT family N-acetyltransferase n=1 Tax=Geodermatophilus bullaregiensis TaxID=1564160 RepID=UPI00195953D4|nr:GNAT family N-acetyltransferase [Geodermatophilus bullaregiensis]MBM7805770.1 RimJ/RimL family protein N-acetyltransferase [Geodermatophilus bullaregiensis]